MILIYHQTLCLNQNLIEIPVASFIIHYFDIVDTPKAIEKSFLLLYKSMLLKEICKQHYTGNKLLKKIKLPTHFCNVSSDFVKLAGWIDF